MKPPVLTDKNQLPTTRVIESHIGRSNSLWQSLFDFIHREHPDFSEQWRYYNDGKRWLLKVSRKSKTIFWLSVVRGAVRTTFYFTDKADHAISRSLISDDLKKQYRAQKGSGKLRGVTILYKRRRDVEDAKCLIGIKMNVK